MNATEIVDAYLAGRLNSWGVYKRLVQLGVSAATALAVAGALGTAVSAQDITTVSEIQRSVEDAGVLDELTARLAAQLQRIDAGGPIRPLVTTLAKAGANNANLLNDCQPLALNFNDGQVNLTGELNVRCSEPGNNSVGLVLNGAVGQSNVNLSGIIQLPDDVSAGNNTNLGKVNLNFNGNVGAVSLDIFGNVGGPLTTRR